MALSQKIIIITGAARGLGQTYARRFAELGNHLVVCDLRDCAETVAQCQQAGAEAIGFETDVTKTSSTEAMAARAVETFGRIDVLINNAGLLTRQRQETADGIERQFAVNHLAPFLLTTQLLAKLKASSPARIVTVASMAHRRAALDLNDLNWERRRYNGITAYGATKLANILFTRELARRLEDTGVTANCLHPGVVATNLVAGMGIPGSVFGNTPLGRPV